MSDDDDRLNIRRYLMFLNIHGTIYQSNNVYYINGSTIKTKIKQAVDCLWKLER